ncbi:MAG: hypothetical protein M3Q75_01030 [Gemmatimonadota bacterium]|nr:hypothetical protein [Gemmatimonadota bacterium]
MIVNVDDVTVSVRSLGPLRNVYAYAVTVSRGGMVLFETVGRDDALSLPSRDDKRAVRDALGFLSAYGDSTSGAGTYVPALAPYAAEFATLADPDQCDGCDQDPWTVAVHYGDCPLAVTS